MPSLSFKRPNLTLMSWVINLLKGFKHFHEQAILLFPNSGLDFHLVQINLSVPLMTLGGGKVIVDDVVDLEVSDGDGPVENDGQTTDEGQVVLWTQRMGSPPSFCNSLGTIYIASSRERTIDLTTRDMGSKLRYSLRKVLGTQNHPTLRLASSHCVLCLNPIKGTFNFASILTHTPSYI